MIKQMHARYSVGCYTNAVVPELQHLNQGRDCGVNVEQLSKHMLSNLETIGFGVWGGLGLHLKSLFKVLLIPKVRTNIFRSILQ